MNESQRSLLQAALFDPIPLTDSERDFCHRLSLADDDYILTDAENLRLFTIGDKYE